MDFHLSAEIEELRRRYRAFVAERVMPLEADPAAYDGHENIRLELLEDLRAGARDAGLWAPQMPRERGAEQPLIARIRRYRLKSSQDSGNLDPQRRMVLVTQQRGSLARPGLPDLWSHALRRCSHDLAAQRCDG